MKPSSINEFSFSKSVGLTVIPAAVGDTVHRLVGLAFKTAADSTLQLGEPVARAQGPVPIGASRVPFDADYLVNMVIEGE